jgi:hypothetical protein
MREGREHIPSPSVEKPAVDVEKREQELNEIVPMLAHGLVRKLERKGLAGKVRIRAVAGSDWGVATSPENPAKDVPDVIVYPREYLSKDQKLVNARLRHEVGNLNYPIEEGLNDLRVWCEERGIAPALVTPLAQAVHEASVNYLEMQNAFSAHPEDNFKALYEEEVDTAGMAEQIKDASPYKQAVTLTLLYSLSQTGIIPKEHFNQGLANARTEVRDLFDARTKSVIDQAVKIAVPQKQVHLIREYLWPTFAQFATSADVPEKSDAPQGEVKQEGSTDLAGLTQIEKMHREVEEMREKIRQAYKEKSKEEQQPEQNTEQRSGRPKQELSPAEQKERDQAQDLLKQALSGNLQNLQEQLQKAQEQAGKESAPSKPKPQTMEELAEQAKQLQEQLEALKKEAGQDQALQEQLEALAEQAEQIEEVAKYVAKPEEAALEEEPMTYNIKEYGIDESKLTEEQKEILEKTRHFAQETTKVYRGVMRLLMQAYQQKNPNFTDKIISRIKEKGYDLPDFSLYGSKAGEQFLQSNKELGIEELPADDFLVNFNLPKPFGRFWYKGGQGSKSIPVKEGEIEWGEFYRRSMPVVWSAVDRAMMQGLYLQRLNEFGQHDYKKYYYLWEAMGLELPEPAGEQDDQGDEAQEGQESAEGAESRESGGADAGEEGVGGEEGQGAREGGGEAEAGEVGSGAESGGGMPSAQEMQEFLNQMQQGLEQAMEQAGMPGGQEAMQQMMSELKQMQEALESGASPEDIAGQLSDLMGELSGMMEGLESQGQSTEGQFEHPDPQLLQELQEFEQSIESQFSRQEKDGNYSLAEVDTNTLDLSEKKFNPTETVAWRDAFGTKGKGKNETRKMEFTGTGVIGGPPKEIEFERLSIESTRKKYEEYEKEMREFTDSVIDFFRRKLYADQDRQYVRNQRRGARLQRGWQRNIVGIKDRKAVVRPESFERRLPPERSDFSWTIIVDNSVSCSGETFEQEKKYTIAMVEAAKDLGIPVEVVTFNGTDPKFHSHLKTFDDVNDDRFIEKLLSLKANQLTPDSEVLSATIQELKEQDDSEEVHRFVFSLTDGFHSVCTQCDGTAGCSDPYHPESDPHKPDKLTKDIIKEHGEDIVLIGIGFGDAAKLISVTWDENALEVPELDPRKFSEQFLQKVEEKMEESFK